MTAEPSFTLFELISKIPVLQLPHRVVSGFNQTWKSLSLREHRITEYLGLPYRNVWEILFGGELPKRNCLGI